MIFGQAIRILNQQQKSTIRKVENISRKIVQTEAAVYFNQICIQEDLLPTYTNIYICIYVCKLVASPLEYILD